MSKDPSTIYMPARSFPPSALSEVPGTTGGTQRELIVAGHETSASILDEIRRSPAARLDIEARAASGGMGAIDVAVDRALDRRIAIKTLHSHLRGSESAVRMFLREARLTGLLDHPHIVPVYDVGERDGDRLYFSMKLVEGQTLSAVIHALSPGPMDTATLYSLLDVVTKVCDALAFAHSRGVVHCDVKPSNVMVGDFGQVYLMDWGIARLVEADDAPPASTTDHAVIGTSCYMSPEQAAGHRRALDFRSDVFLLGSLLYEILTRRPPYSARDRSEILALAAAGTFPSPRTVAGEVAVAPELDRIVLRAMAKRPEDRYPSVSALREDLVRFMRGGGEFPRQRFAAGSVIVREGETGEAAYIVVSGRCDVRKGPPPGTQTLQTIGPGDVFGEMAILTEGPRTASVVAVEDTDVLVVTATALEREMAALKPWMASLMKSLAVRFRNIDAASRSSAAPATSPARIANQILMHVMTWGDEDDAGARAVSWKELSRELEAQLGYPVFSALGAIARYGMALDVDGDRLTIADPGELTARLRADLAAETKAATTRPAVS